MLDDIAEKYNRPHRKTNALLAGLVYCPHYGKRLRVISESNRWTNGKPRFKYVCPGYRVGECTFRAVDGVLLDEFVVQQFSHLADEDSEYFEKLLNQKASDIFCSSQNEKELSDLRKKKAQLETAIANQVKNLREADNSLKRFIQEDVKALTDELSETETLLQKLEDIRQSQMYAIRDIEEIKERLLSFGKYAENAAPVVLVTLIQTFVERIYITDENDERHCHIFIKGCSKEDYDDFFRATGYIENTQETGTVTSVLPVCDSDECCKCDTILNHTGLYEYRHGKMLMHLRFIFEALSDLSTPGEYMRYYRQLRGLTTRQLAEKLNIVPATVLGYEQGRFPIPYEISVVATQMMQIPKSLLFDDFCVFISAPYTELLHKVRKRHGLNQVDFAENAGISPSIYAKRESGSRRPSRKMHQQLKVIYPEI